MLDAFFQNLTIPLLLIVNVLAYLGLSEVLLNYIEKKSYVITGIIAVVATGIFGPVFAFVEAAIVGARILYRRYKQSREP